jgi:hypothetical protein
MNRNEEVKPSFLAEFTPHKSTKKKRNPNTPCRKIPQRPAGNATAPYHTAGNRKQKSAARSQLSNLFRRYR